MSSSNHSEESSSQMPRPDFSFENFEEYVDDDETNNQPSSNEQSTISDDGSKTQKRNKKTLGRVKIEMAYIDNKIRRYTTFSKRKTGIMKKAYELSTLTGTEVMLLVASETGHVYTYATAKLKPMITSEAGKALIQTCLAKEEPIVDPVIDTAAPTPAPTPAPCATTLNNDDVIFIDGNQRKKRCYSRTSS